MTKIHSPAGLSFLSPVKNRRPAKRKSVLESPVIQKFKCACPAIHYYSNVNVARHVSRENKSTIHSDNVTTKTLLATAS